MPSGRAFDPDGDDLTFGWTKGTGDFDLSPTSTLFPNVSFSETPTVILDDTARVDACPPTTALIDLTYTVSDGEAAAQGEVRVHFRDLEPPIFDECPPDISVCCGDSTDPADIGMAGAIDACQIDAPVTSYTDAGGSVSCPDGGTITRTWDAEDLCGNVTTELHCSRTGRGCDTAFEGLVEDLASSESALLTHSLREAAVSANTRCPAVRLRVSHGYKDIVANTDFSSQSRKTMPTSILAEHRPARLGCPNIK